MTRLTDEAVRQYIEKRYPEQKVLAVEIFESRDMAFVLTMYNTSTVSRYVVDINSDGDMDVWSLECARYEEVYKREDM